MKPYTCADNQPRRPKYDFSKTALERDQIAAMKDEYRSRMRTKHGNQWRKHQN